MKGIQCGFVHKALSAIDEAEEDAYLDLDHRLVDFFKEKGLVSAYSTWFYHEMLAGAAKIKRARIRLDTVTREAAGYERSIDNIEQNIKSTWAYSSREVEEMKELLATRRSEYRAKQRAAEKIEEKIDKLEAMPVSAEDYRLTIDGNYVMLTEKGGVWLKCLSGRLDEFGDAPMENFEREIEEFESRIDRYCARAVEALELMGSRGLGKHNHHTIDCAVRLAATEYTIPEAYSRMRTINDFLYDKSEWHDGVKYYERLIPASAVAMQPENIGMLKEELIETYKALTDDNYYENFFTWWLASAVMELNRFDVERNIERYEEVLAALVKKGWGGLSWEKTKCHTCYMAANLARGMDSPEELARQLKIQHQRLINTGRSDSSDLATASLILLDSDRILEERTERFAETWEEMDGYGWGRFYMFYPAAAALSVMPYSVAENVMWLDRIVRRLKEYGLEDKSDNRKGMRDGLTYRALDILMAAYKGQFRKEVMPRIIAHSEDSLVQSSN